MKDESTPPPLTTRCGGLDDVGQGLGNAERSHHGETRARALCKGKQSVLAAQFASGLKDEGSSIFRLTFSMVDERSWLPRIHEVP